MQISIDHEIQPKTHPPMYLMHKYWARKPYNIVAFYIKKYTNKGEIVLDPFMGSGVSIIEANLQGKKAIGIDINPISVFITRNTGKRIDIKYFEKLTLELEILVKKSAIYNYFNTITCPFCKNKAEITHVIWEKNTEHNKKTKTTNFKNIKQKNKKDKDYPNHYIAEIRINCKNCNNIQFSNEINKVNFENIRKKIIELETKAELIIDKLFSIGEEENNSKNINKNNSKNINKNNRKNNSKNNSKNISKNINNNNNSSNCKSINYKDNNKVIEEQIDELLQNNEAEIKRKILKEILEIKEQITKIDDLRYSNTNNFMQLRHQLREKPRIRMMYTSRAFITLHFIRKKIKNLEKRLIKKPSIEGKLGLDLSELLIFTFTSAVSQASKMVWIIDKRNGRKLQKKEVGSWTHHFFWDANNYFEINPWNCIQQRIKKIIRGKKDLKKRTEKSQTLPFIEAENFDQLSEDKPILLINDSSEKIPLPDGSIDFIFTDPPYGDSIQYGELSALWAYWRGFDLNEYISKIGNKELVINQKQGKNPENYRNRMKKVFNELYRVLKKEHYMIVTFHNTSMDIRNSLITACLSAGFSLEQITFQIPPRVSIKSMLHYKGSPIGDYYIRFYKRLEQKQKKIEDYIKLNQYNNDSNQFNKRKQIPIRKDEDLDVDEIRKLLEEILIKILRERGEPTLPIWLANLIDEQLFLKRIIPSKKIEKQLKNITKWSKKIIEVEQGWWLSEVFLSSIKDKKDFLKEPLSLRIEIFITKLLKKEERTKLNKLNIIQKNNIEEKNKEKKKIKKKKNEYKSTIKQEIYNKIYEKFNGIETPDKFMVSKIIDKIISNGTKKTSKSALKKKK